MKTGSRGHRLALLDVLTLCLALRVSCHDNTQGSAVCAWKMKNSLSVIEQSDGWETCPLASDWSLWSHNPTCLERVDTQDDEDSPADCVFSLTTFRHNQGISLITTPNLAASLTNSMDDSILTSDLRTHLQSQRSKLTSSYEIRELRGRGKGLVASRNIPRYKTIMVGFPVLIVRLGFINDGRLTERQKRRMMQTAVRQLPAVQRDAVMSLSRSTGGEPILDILRTNAFGIEVDGEQHLGLFVDGSVCMASPLMFFFVLSPIN